LGIRGTEFAVVVKANGTTIVILNDGTVIVTNEKGITQTLTIPGLATIIARGKVPTKPSQPPQDVLDYLRDLLPLNLEGVTWEQSNENDNPELDKLRTSLRRDVTNNASNNADNQAEHQAETLRTITEEEKHHDGGTPTPSVIPSGTPIPSPTSTPAPTSTPLPTPTPSPTPTPFTSTLGKARDIIIAGNITNTGTIRAI
jgi:hypothetical protein